MSRLFPIIAILALALNMPGCVAPLYSTAPDQNQDDGTEIAFEAVPEKPPNRPHSWDADETLECLKLYLVTGPLLAVGCFFSVITGHGMIGP